ncbi:MAG: FIG00467019: hypothetical protein [uncultured Paraburkholderia sp.]|uniref:hypothetical protein n=1 Tax=uncultured Paraburkholderia sp. TaxID=1822466 RepID=UPI002593D315|nr:hypothetical protein [uncultured Paraburkholderia sp.]CAH2895542.1 MAG: FIG00467019: hypothetical protein [uncultured Paraburkholderia sp.]CAH2933331.1 MAG: FIG00467019: hypothetical protein [uncultured Paraburkholderia sp.]
MPKTSASPFALAERAIISLYDGGVLSPAVLERLLAVFAQENTDWNAKPSQRTVDGRSLHEVVVLTMLPGESLRSASKSFLSVIEHIAGVSRTKNPESAAEDVDEHEEESADQDDDSAKLAQQLSGSARATRRGRAANVKDKARNKDEDSDSPTRQPKRTAAFNPLLNAAAPRKSKN